MKSLSYHPKVKRLKRSNLTTIKSIFVAFADTWQRKLCIYIPHKNNTKSNVMKGNYHSDKFLSYFLVVFTKFLYGIKSSISKVKYFNGKNLPTEEF